MAPRAPLEGDLGNVEVGVLATVWNIYRNAFIEALSRQIEYSVQFTSGDQAIPESRAIVFWPRAQ